MTKRDADTSRFRLRSSVLPATAIVLLGSLLAGSCSMSTPQIRTGEDLRAAVARLKPGDELLVPGGSYEFDSRLRITAVGTPDRPITIRPRPGEEVLIRMDTRRQNIVEVYQSRHLIIRGITLTGGSQGIVLVDSDFITIEDCEIYETGDVAIAANRGGTYEGLVLRRNHIHHTNGTGEGMYLGCNHDKCRVLNSLIEGNYVHHTNRASVHQGDGIEIKEGSAGNIVRHNVIHDTNYPGILVFSTVGNGGPNIVEGNLVWSSNDNGIQAAADAIIRNNIVLGAPIALQKHQSGTPSNLTVVHNTVITPEAGIQVRDVTGPVVVANNAVYARNGPAIRLISGDLSQVTVAGNVVGGGLDGRDSGYVEGGGITRDFVRGHYSGAPPIDLYPSANSALIEAGIPAYATAYDFNGTRRPEGSVDAGAYAYDRSGNPGGNLIPAFKEFVTLR